MARYSQLLENRGDSRANFRLSRSVLLRTRSVLHSKARSQLLRRSFLHVLATSVQRRPILPDDHRQQILQSRASIRSRTLWCVQEIATKKQKQRNGVILSPHLCDLSNGNYSYFRRKIVQVVFNFRLHCVCYSVYGGIFDRGSVIGFWY
jgi:hypothetical protein